MKIKILLQFLLKNPENLRRIIALADGGNRTAGLMHDLRNQLNAISLLTQEMDAETGRKEKRFSKIEDICDNLVRMADNVLDFTRIGSQENSSIDLRTELEKAVMLEGNLKSENIITHFRCDNLPFILAPRYIIRQVFANLYSNAVQVLRKNGGGKINLSLQSNGRFVIFTITDTGTGIPAGNLSKIFDPFFTTKGESGTGLGLGMVKNYLDIIDGEIEVKSPPGKGATFIVRFPFKAKGGELDGGR
jgi:two-component system NtrC family sensor kinase